MQNAGMPSLQITIRNVPLHVRNTLAARAAREQRSMQEYLLRQLERLASLPTIEEWADKVREDKADAPVSLSVDQILGDLSADRR